jgi:D-sedoheptulose 7-phosphate isomerase
MKNKKNAELKIIVNNIHQSVDVVRSLLNEVPHIQKLARVFLTTIERGGKILTAGNGGSAAEALHMAEELVGRFKHNRIALPAIALVADCTAITCIGNDYGFDMIFSRQIEALGRKGDLLALFSTSGKALNLQQAAQTARKLGMKTVCFLGRDGGPLLKMADYAIVVTNLSTERIQEAHLVLIHLILDIIETKFSNTEGKKALS